MKNILVTGAAGQVGKAIRSVHQDYEHNFIFADKTSLDITNQLAVDSFIKAKQIDIIINCAAYTAVDLAENEQKQCFLINEKAVGFLAQACAQNGGQLFHISSDYVYHHDGDTPMKEVDSTSPKGIYAKSKLAGEQLALDICSNSVILRTSWVYGNDGNNFVKTISRLAKDRSSLTVVNDQIGSPTYAPDIAKVLLQLIAMSDTKKISGIYNFCNAGYISWFDFATEIVRYQGYNCRVDPVPSSAYPTAAERPKNSRMDTSKIQNMGVTLVPWKQSLHLCLDSL